MMWPFLAIHSQFIDQELLCALNHVTT